MGDITCESADDCTNDYHDDSNDTQRERGNKTIDLLAVDFEMTQKWEGQEKNEQIRNQIEQDRHNERSHGCRRVAVVAGFLELPVERDGTAQEQIEQDSDDTSCHGNDSRDVQEDSRPGVGGNNLVVECKQSILHNPQTQVVGHSGRVHDLEHLDLFHRILVKGLWELEVRQSTTHEPPRICIGVHGDPYKKEELGNDQKGIFNGEADLGDAQTHMQT